MLKEETLRRNGNREYDEPDGEFMEIISHGNNTITVLTRINTDKVVESPPVDPTELTVSELTEALDDENYQWNVAALRDLLEAEEAGQNRTTAIQAIKDKINELE